MSTYRMATCGIGTALAAVLTLMMVPSGASITDDGPTMYGMAEVTFRDANGDVLSYNTLHNAITNDGERAILNAVFLNQTMDPPVVICLSDIDSGTDPDRELANKTFSHTSAFAPFNPPAIPSDPLYRMVFDTTFRTITPPQSAAPMVVTAGSETTVNTTEYVTTESTILPAGSVVIINGRTITLEHSSFIGPNRTVISVTTTTGFPGVQNVTFGSGFTNNGFTYEPNTIFFYDIEEPDAPALPIGSHDPPLPFSISNTTDTFTYEFEPNTENQTGDFNENGVIDQDEWDIVFVQPEGARAPCKVSPPMSATLIEVPIVPVPGDDVIPELLNQTTLTVIPGAPANVTVNEENSTAVISANFTTNTTVSYSLSRIDQSGVLIPGSFVTTSANFEPDMPLNTMLICTLDPSIPTDRPEAGFPDCDLASGPDGILFSIIKLEGQMAGPNDRVEVTYTLDLTSGNS